MRYAYGLFMLLGAYLLYTEDINSKMLGMLYFFIVIGLLSFMIDYFSQYALFKRWLHQFF